MIGEVAKWIPVNVVRFSGISYDSSSVSVTLRGVQGETIAVRGLAVSACVRVRACDVCLCQVSFYNTKSQSVTSVSCTFGEEGTLVASVPAGTCVAP